MKIVIDIVNKYVQDFCGPKNAELNIIIKENVLTNSTILWNSNKEDPSDRKSLN